eukprot:PhM_4_TR13604/c0_g1_i2/m.60464
MAYRARQDIARAAQMMTKEPYTSNSYATPTKATLGSRASPSSASRLTPSAIKSSPSSATSPLATATPPQQPSVPTPTRTTTPTLIEAQHKRRFGPTTITTTTTSATNTLRTSPISSTPNTLLRRSSPRGDNTSAMNATAALSPIDSTMITNTDVRATYPRPGLASVPTPPPPRGTTLPHSHGPPRTIVTDRSKPLLEQQEAIYEGKLVVVLDLDETLMYGRGYGRPKLRPGVQQFLNALKEMECEVVLWTAGDQPYAFAMLEILDPTTKWFKHCIYRHPRWWSGPRGHRKDLTLLGRPVERTLIVENTPDCVLGHEGNAILVSDYTGTTPQDTTMDHLAMALRQIAGDVYSGEAASVTDALTRCGFVTQRTVGADATSLPMTLWTVSSDSRVISTNAIPRHPVGAHASPSKAAPSPARGSGTSGTTTPSTSRFSPGHIRPTNSFSSGANAIRRPW